MMSDVSAAPRRAAIYARVSSKQQAEAKTVASQLEALQARIQADGLILESELQFIDEGYSGGTGGTGGMLLRPALERLRDQAAAGSFDRLYVHSPDRLARHYPYQVLLVEELQRHGIQMVFLNHDIGRTPEENLLLHVQGMMAEYECAKILERSRRSKRHAAWAGAVNVLSGARTWIPKPGSKELRPLGVPTLRDRVMQTALLHVYFIVLLVEALLESELRRGMDRAGLETLPLYPDGRPCRWPTARRVIDLFEPVQRHVLETTASSTPVVTQTAVTQRPRCTTRCFAC
jgi:DNA invertase Pin-like site-specific DNA recombinase